MAALVVPLAALAVMFTTGAASGSGGTDANGQPTATVDQCSKPMSERHGGWVCIDPAASREMMQQYAAERAKGRVDTAPVTVERTAYTGGSVAAVDPAAVESTSGDGIAGWCNTSGCWTFWSGENYPNYYHSEYNGKGSYGYCDANGCRGIGDIKVHIVDWLNNGSYSLKVVNQQRSSTAATKANSWFDTNYLVNGTYPYGTPCGTSKTQTAVNKSAGTWATWDGIVLNECSYSTQATFHRLYWRDYNYPGRWYLFEKSAKFTHQSGVQSHYLGDWDTPSAPLGPSGAGWENK